MDSVLFEHPELLKGISQNPPVPGTKLTVWDMIDFRCRPGYLERVGYTEIEQKALLDPQSCRIVYHDGTIIIIDACTGLAMLGTALVYTNGMDGTANFANEPNESFIPLGERIVGINGAAGVLNYPANGVLYIHKPSLLPKAFSTGRLGRESCTGSTNFEAAHPEGGMLLQPERSLVVYGAHGFGDSILIYSKGSVVLWSLQPFAQKVLSKLGCWDYDSWAGDHSVGWFIGKDRNLYTVGKDGISKLGFGWIWPQQTTFKLSWVEETKDLLIFTNGPLGPNSYLFSGGLSRTSIAFVQMLWSPDNGIMALGIDGKIYAVSMPDAVTFDFDWASWVPTEGNPQTYPSITTMWFDGGVSLQKHLSAIEVVQTPAWPTVFRVENRSQGRADPGAAFGYINAPVPIGEFSLNGVQFRVEFWLPEFSSAGAWRAAAFRSHLKSTDLRGMYAVAQSSQQ